MQLQFRNIMHHQLIRVEKVEDLMSQHRVLTKELFGLLEGISTLLCPFPPDLSQQCIRQMNHGGQIGYEFFVAIQ